MKIDLHVHSRYSNETASQDPIISFFKSKESFSEPEDIYNLARTRGMDLVTITDHDSIDGCLKLKERHPESVILGVESTVFFPEDGHPVHLLIYGFTESQFTHIDKLKTDIYSLRDYLMTEQIVCSVAHATYRLDERMSIDHIEKLLLLFNSFEGVNGCRNSRANNGFMDIVSSLTPELMCEMEKKHEIKPNGATPWKKSLIAGSDDHAGLFIGTVYTEVDSDSAEDASSAILSGKTSIAGESRTHRLFAMQIYKIVHENLKARSGKNRPVLSTLLEYLLLEKQHGLIDRYKLWRIAGTRTEFRKYIHSLFAIRRRKNLSYEERLNELYKVVVQFSDDMLSKFIKTLISSFESGTLTDFLNNIKNFLSGIFVYVPVGFALKYLNKDILFTKKLLKRFNLKKKNYRKKILWFTDTINDMNGVSVTLRNIGWLSHQRGDDLHIVSSVLADEPLNQLPPNFINLKALFHFSLPFYNKLTIKVPSLLSMIETLYSYEPDEIYISSPGIIGLYGLIYAKLTGVKCMAVYHTDFAQQAKRIIGKETPVIDIIEGYIKWFHESADKILVPTQEYIDILSKREYDESKLGIFYRGIDANYFEPKKEGRAFLYSKLDLTDGINLVFAGRISQDKNIDFLIKSYCMLKERGKKANLIFAGDGPYLEQLKTETAGLGSIHFLGEIPHSMLPLVYSGADILVFPSETDTFGMVVLEAQACGVPALVSNIGGPKEIIRNMDTGFILDTRDAVVWADKLEEMINWIEQNDDRYHDMRRKARLNVISRFEYDKILDTFFLDTADNQAESMPSRI